MPDGSFDPAELLRQGAAGNYSFTPSPDDGSAPSTDAPAAASPGTDAPASASPAEDAFDPAALMGDAINGKFKYTPLGAVDTGDAKTGYAANMAAGAVEGGAGLANMIADPVGNMIGKPLMAAGVALHHALAPVFGYADLTPEHRAALLDDDVPQPGTRLATAVGQAMGAPSLDQVKPADDGQRMARAGAAGAVGMAAMAPAGLTAAPANAGVVRTIAHLGANGLRSTVAPAAGFVGGVAGQLAEDAVPDAYKPIANMAAQAAAGGATLGTAAIAKGTKRAVGAQLSHMAEPLTEDGRQAMAAAKLQAAATDPAAAAAAIDANGQSPVPGYQPTTFQAARDQGLGNLERAVATSSPDPFLTRRNEQNAALVGSLESVEPDGASPEAASALFRGQLARIDADNAATEAAAQQAHEAAQRAEPAPQTALLTEAQRRTSALGGAVPVGADAQETALQGYGKALRDPVLAQEEAAKAESARLKGMIDPDGTLAIDLSPVKAQVANELSSFSPNAKPIGGEEAEIFAQAKAMPAVQSFADLSAFRTRVQDAMRAELSENGRTPSYARLTGILNSIHDSMDAAVQGQAARDQAAVASGAMPRAESMLGRLEAAEQAAHDGQAGQAGGLESGPRGLGDSATGVRGQVSGGLQGSGEAPVLSQRGGSQDAQGQGARLGSGVRPVASAAANERLTKPESLVDRLIAHGGIKDDGDLAAMGLDSIHHRQGGRLVNNKSGLPLDRAVTVAKEHGFIPNDYETDIGYLKERLADHRDGFPTYRPEDEAIAAAWHEGRHADNMQAYHRELSAEKLNEVERATGARLSDAEFAHATDLLVHDPYMLPLEAARQASLHSERAALDANAARNAVGSPGVPLAAQQAEMPVEGGRSALTPDWDEGASRRYEEYRQSVRTRHAKFTDAPGVGAMIKPGKFQGEYDLPLSRVPSALFSGANQAERVQSFLNAGGARQSLLDYAAFDLRRSAENADGTLNPAKANNWLTKNAEAAAVLPELRTMAEPAVRARVALDAGTAQAKAARDEAAAAAQAAYRQAAAKRVEERIAFEKSPAGKFLGEGDPKAAAGRILDSPMAVPDMRKLARMTANDPAARAGLQRAVVDRVMDQVKSNAAAGNTGTTLLKSDTFQTWLRRREPALREIFPADRIENMRNVATELQNANRSISGTKLPGGSNTAQDTAAGAKHKSGPGHSVLTQMIGAELVGSVAHAGAEALLPGSGFLAHAIGTGATIGTLYLNAMRAAGIAKVNALVTEAMLNPALGKTLLLRTTKQGAPGVLYTLKRQLRGLAATSGIRAPQDDQRRPRPAVAPLAARSAAPRPVAPLATAPALRGLPAVAAPQPRGLPSVAMTPTQTGADQARAMWAQAGGR
jgi:hypothetical protein